MQACESYYREYVFVVYVDVCRCSQFPTVDKGKRNASIGNEYYVSVRNESVRNESEKYVSNPAFEQFQKSAQVATRSTHGCPPRHVETKKSQIAILSSSTWIADEIRRIKNRILKPIFSIFESA
jgi:hypothetical protein